jgi:SWIB/MDM2 domain
MSNNQTDMSTVTKTVKRVVKKVPKAKPEPVAEPAVVEPAVVEPAVVEKTEAVEETEAVEPTVDETVDEALDGERSTERAYKQYMEVLIKSRLDTIEQCKREVAELRKLQKLQFPKPFTGVVGKPKKIKRQRDYSKPIKHTGFSEPHKVSDALYDFLIKTKAVRKDENYTPKSDEEYKAWPRVLIKKGDLVARTDVTSHLAKYVREHELNDASNKRNIIPDATLKKILAPSEEYTILKFQKYINQHFPQRPKEVPVQVPTA